MNLTWFRNEPATLYVGILTAVVAVVVHLTHASAHASAIYTAIAVALGGVLTAALTRPLNPPMVTAAMGALIMVVSGYWVHLSASSVQSVAIAAGALLCMILRGHQSPVGPGPAGN